MNFEYYNEILAWINRNPDATYQEYIKQRDELRKKYREAKEATA